MLDRSIKSSIISACCNSDSDGRRFKSCWVGQAFLVSAESATFRCSRIRSDFRRKSCLKRERPVAADDIQGLPSANPFIFLITYCASLTRAKIRACL